MKNELLISLAILGGMVLFGYVLPTLISSDDDISVIAGVVVTVLVAVKGGTWIKSKSQSFR